MSYFRGRGFSSNQLFHQAKSHSRFSQKKSLNRCQKCFLNGDLQEQVYILSPPSYSHPSHQVLRLQQALYDLKQLPKSGLQNLVLLLLSWILLLALMTHPYLFDVLIVSMFSFFSMLMI